MISPHEYARQRSAPADPLQGGLGRGGDYSIGGTSGVVRESRRTEGRSFIHASDTPKTSGSRLSARSISSGGLSPAGPAPTGGPPPEPQRIGPSGPSKMAPGVKGDFEKAAPRLWGFPKWGETTAGVVKGIAGASVAAGSLTAQTLGGVANSSIGGRIARTALGQMLGVGRTQTRPTLPTIDLDEINPDFL